VLMGVLVFVVVGGFCFGLCCYWWGLVLGVGVGVPFGGLFRLPFLWFLGCLCFLVILCLGFFFFGVVG